MLWHGKLRNTYHKSANHNRSSCTHAIKSPDIKISRLCAPTHINKRLYLLVGRSVTHLFDYPPCAHIGAFAGPIIKQLELTVQAKNDHIPQGLLHEYSNHQISTNLITRFFFLSSFPGCFHLTLYDVWSTDGSMAMP